MTKSELLKLCMLSGATADYPFEDSENVVLRHTHNRKWFALIFEQNGELCINLKGEPMQNDFLRSVYKGVLPAWHMNKVHWNKVIVNSDVTTTELEDMIETSYNMTRK